MVVATRDRPRLLAEALEAIAGAVAAGDEIVVVDSASHDPEVGRVAERAGVRVVRCSVPGAALARNAGAAAVDAPIVAFTDDDCRPASGWADALAGAFADPCVGFVTGRILPDDAAAGTVSIFVSETPRVHRWGDDPASFGHGANLAVRRDAFADVGGFDSDLGAGAAFRGAEDQDLCLRLLHHGWTGCYVPAAVVVHHQWRTRGEALRLEYGYGTGGGALAVKLMQIAPRDGRRLLARCLWTHGLAAAARELAAGHQRAALGDVLRAAGVAGGAARYAAGLRSRRAKLR